MSNPKDYTVGWICALDTEYVAAQEFLDDKHEPPEFVSPNDTNHYTLGKLGQHNVVIAVLPDGEYGTVSAASIATNMLRSFPNIRIGLMVGIGGGVPSEKHDIRLGDVVVSAPRHGESGVFHYDFGKTTQEQVFQYVRFMSQPPTVLRTAVMGVKTRHERNGHQLEQAIKTILEKNPRLRWKYERPQPSSDRLFHTKVTHDSRGCEAFCASDPSHSIERPARAEDENNPAIHYGLIASANQLMENALIRDQLAAEKDVLCFEMEAAGLMDYFPCLIIRGICDYSDSHKNKEWQGYAAMAAAAYAKDLLSDILPNKVEAEKRIIEAVSSIQETLQEAHTTIQQTSTVIHNLDSDQKRERLITRLPYAKDSTVDSSDGELDPRCYPGTRIDLLRQAAEWADDRQGKCIFWLNGMAGTGKSTISRTVAEAFTKEGKLGASFFFKRGEADRNSATKFFTTICAQLLVKVPALAVHVEMALDEDPYISRKSMETQFKQLIYQPLSKIQNIPSQFRTLVIVIDALDECERKDDIGIILALLTQAKDIESVKLRIFVTSRPELPVRLGFMDMTADTYQDLVLHEVPRPIIESDIATFLEHKLAEIRNNHNKLFRGSRALPSDWPGPEALRILVQMAVPLFIFAATVCRFIEDQAWSDPAGQLAKVLKYQNRTGESDFDSLDATYSPILDQLISGRTERAKRSLVDNFQKIIGPIIHLAEPLSCSTLASLLDIDSQSIESQLTSLHSVFSVPSSGHFPIRMLHLSFRSFLVDAAKCKTNPFWIDEKETNKILAFKCLERMSVSGCLRKNICNLKSPATLRKKIDSGVIENHLPSDVQYACRYWVYHLQQSETSIQSNDQVHMFLQQHFLHWLESLSLLGRIAESVGLLHALQKLTNDKDSELYRLLCDAVRFIRKNSPIINNAPLQLYSSALIFTPKASIIRNMFVSKIPSWIQQVPEVEPAWNAVLQTLEGHSGWVSSVAFSPDSRVLASGSGDKTVKLWDTATGALSQTLNGHLWSIGSVAFSPDGRVLASGSNDETVKLWNTATGALKRTLEGHSGSVLAVAFSPDGRVLASGSGDKSVKLWNITTGLLQRTLEGHANWIESVAFSPNNQLLASGSEDKTIMLWDVETGAIMRILKGHLGSVLSVAFSPDGQMLASGSNDRKVKLWDTAAGALRLTLDGHSGLVTSVAFASDGRIVASGSNDRTVKLWDAATGTLKQSLNGHVEQVTSVAFSPDYQVLASSSDDRTVRLWDNTANSLQQQQTLDRHLWSVVSLSFSPDGQMLASGSDDKTVKVWNTATGFLKLSLEGHSRSVHSLIFSPDSQLLASGSKDKTIKLWDISTGLIKHTISTNSGLVGPRIFSPDGRVLLAASEDMKDGTVQLWDPATGALIHTLNARIGGILSGAISWDSKMLALCLNENIIRLWGPAPGMLQQTRARHSPESQEMASSRSRRRRRSMGRYHHSPDSSDKNDELRHSDMDELYEWYHTLVHHPIRSQRMDLSQAKGRRRGFGRYYRDPGSSSESDELLDSDTSELRQTPEDNPGKLQAVAFSPDNKLVAAASSYSTVKVWNTATGELKQALGSYSYGVQTLAYTPDGKFLKTDKGLFDIENDVCSIPAVAVDIQVSNEWVTRNGTKVIWLPVEYRATCSARHGNILAMGHDSGRVTFLRLI